MPHRTSAGLFLTALVTAQTPALIYDNGPVETRPGFSNVQFVALGLNVLGYPAMLTTTRDESCYDDFVLHTATIVEEVEILVYQTGAGTSLASTITGAYVAFYQFSPLIAPGPIAGSPAPTFDLFGTPNNPINNSWSGIYREVDGNGAFFRPLMRVRVRLEDVSGVPTPLLLMPGRYWLEYRASGSLWSGPWSPPLTCENQTTTGNAINRDTSGAFTSPILSGGYPQGFPFKLYGQQATPGSITQLVTNNHGLDITVCGAPVVGGFIRTELDNLTANALPVIGFDYTAAPTAFCGSSFVHQFPVALAASEADLQIPLSLTLGGLVIGIQGAELTVPPALPGVCLGAANLSDGYRVKLNF